MILVKKGCRLYRAPTWQVDGATGPLHVSGHGQRDEHREMLELLRPKLFVPIYAGAVNRRYHLEIARQAGVKPTNTFMLDNGDMLTIDSRKVAKVHHKAIDCGSVFNRRFWSNYSKRCY